MHTRRCLSLVDWLNLPCHVTTSIRWTTLGLLALGCNRCLCWVEGRVCISMAFLIFPLQKYSSEYLYIVLPVDRNFSDNVFEKKYVHNISVTIPCIWRFWRATSVVWVTIGAQLFCQKNLSPSLLSCHYLYKKTLKDNFCYIIHFDRGRKWY